MNMRRARRRSGVPPDIGIEEYPGGGMEDERTEKARRRERARGRGALTDVR